MKFGRPSFTTGLAIPFAIIWGGLDAGLVSDTAGPVDEVRREAVTNMPGGSINVFDRDLRYFFAAIGSSADVAIGPRRWTSHFPRF